MEKEQNTKINMALEIFSTDAFLAVNKKLLQKLGFEKTIYICNLVDKYKYFQTQEMLDENGAFFLTHAQQEEQIGMSEYQIRQNKKYFIELGVLETELKGVPPKEFYMIEFEHLINFVFSSPENEYSTGSEALSTHKDIPLNTKGISLPKTKGIYKDTKYKENKLKNINLSEVEEQKIKRTRDPIKTRNKSFLPLAKKLGDIICTNKNINITPSKLYQWSSHIRQLNELEKVEHARIEKALDWYADNIGKQFVPIIESGQSLRHKFISLEAAIERDSSSTPSKTDTAFDADKLIKKYIPQDFLIAAFTKECFSPAKYILDSDSKTILDKLLTLYQFVKDTQDKNMTQELMSILPSPISLVANYLDWIDDNEWITNKQASLLDPDSSLFNRFRREEANKDTIQRDPLTGKSYFSS